MPILRPTIPSIEWKPLCTLLSLVLLVSIGACTGAPGDDASVESSPFQLTDFRIRSGVDVPLDEDFGWAAPAGEPAAVEADRPFRIRVEVEAPEAAGVEQPTRLALQASRNGGEWTTLRLRDFPYPDELSTPRVSLVRVEEWGTGEPTADLLEASALPFAAGEGVSDPLRIDELGDALEGDNAASSWPESGVGGSDDGAQEATPVHGEWEWPVVIRRWADGGVTNDDGDTFDFRLVDGAGRPVAGAGPVRVTLRIPEGHVGGTYVETPGPLGPWQTSDGALFFPMEPAETFNVLMMVASVDHGASWNEVDGANRPVTDDLEGFATDRHDGVIYMLHQISEATVLHAFEPLDGAVDGSAEGRWIIRDEPVSQHSEPPTQVAALAARSDGSLVAVYGDSEGLLLRVRRPDGTWRAEERLTVDGGGLASGVMAVRAADDRVHLAYTVTTSDGSGRSVRHRVVSPEGGWTAEVHLGEGIGTAEEDVGALLPLGWLPESNTVVVVWRRADGTLWERRIEQDGSVGPPTLVTSGPVVQNGSDSEQVGADLVIHEGAVHLVYIDAETGGLRHTVSRAAGVWTPGRPVVDGITAQWVRGRVVRDADGSMVYGLVFDAGSDGGSGMNRYVSVPLG
jgi:hypothetical protein